MLLHCQRITSNRLPASTCLRPMPFQLLPHLLRAHPTDNNWPRCSRSKPIVALSLALRLEPYCPAPRDGPSLTSAICKSGIRRQAPAPPHLSRLPTQTPFSQPIEPVAPTAYASLLDRHAPAAPSSPRLAE
ncbi:hypothetical protein K402DRAFT_91139 [Aulographum hederae CBS 113979]|uniref:Uncharacterized protein n=1 Tax=Aulographum hederae CBS 113979 TaxID=1176131 RepID=A0A6G1GZC4_9PEZI|nr:hypothetical protein K402DRAFT_91139 [Aulographum hederae CBS 113979]